MIPSGQYNPPPDPEHEQKLREDANNRTAGSALGGAILGGSLFGPIGAIIGGLSGIYLAQSVNAEKKKQEDRDDG